MNRGSRDGRGHARGSGELQILLVCQRPEECSQIFGPKSGVQVEEIVAPSCKSEVKNYLVVVPVVAVYPAPVVDRVPGLPTVVPAVSRVPLGGIIQLTIGQV